MIAIVLWVIATPAVLYIGFLMGYAARGRRHWRTFERLSSALNEPDRACERVHAESRLPHGSSL